MQREVLPRIEQESSTGLRPPRWSPAEWKVSVPSYLEGIINPRGGSSSVESGWHALLSQACSLWLIAWWFFQSIPYYSTDAAGNVQMYAVGTGNQHFLIKQLQTSSACSPCASSLLVSVEQEPRDALRLLQSIANHPSTCGSTSRGGGFFSRLLQNDPAPLSHTGLAGGRCQPSQTPQAKRFSLMSSLHCPSLGFIPHSSLHPTLPDSVPLPISTSFRALQPVTLAYTS